MDNQCKKCGGAPVYTIKLIPTSRPDLMYHPKYIPSIKATCQDCDCFIKIVRQTPELIEKLNKHFKTQGFIDSFQEKHKDQDQQDFTDWLNK